MSAPAEPRTIELAIGGMTCAACAARVEKKLNRIEGVAATVNYATEKAKVSFPQSVSPERLIEQVVGAGYTARLPEPTEAAEQPLPLRRLVFSVVAAVPIIAVAMVGWLQFPGWQWVSLLLAVPVVFWGGAGFHRAAYRNARHGAATMDTLISVGTLAAFAWSVYALFAGPGGGSTAEMSGMGGLTTDGTAHVYFEVAAGIIVFLLAGKYFEARAKYRAGSALRALLELGAKEVSVLREDREIRVPIAELGVGELFLVRPGEKVATDGTVVAGYSALDRSLLTGESRPVDVAPGDTVTGATVNSGGLLTVRATVIGAETQLARMAALVEQAQTGKAPVQRMADEVAGIFVPVVFAIALLTLNFWIASGAGAAAAVGAGVAVLIIACPCALGLATPTALLVGTGRGAQLGILITGPQVLESTRRIDTVVLDKTGTLTTGELALTGIVRGGAVDDEKLLALAASVEYGSQHPVARAIVAAADEHGIERTALTRFIDHHGRGVRGHVDGHEVVVGRAALLAENSIEVCDHLVAAKADAEAAGDTAVFVAWDGRAHGVLTVADTLKPTSAAAISELHALGLRTVLLTGDNAESARAVAARVGIDSVIADVLPEQKLAAIQDLQHQGRTVAMVGDGSNDAAALAQSDLGIAMGTGTDVAIEAGDITLVAGDLRAVGTAIRLSRKTLRTIKGNLCWAFGYNIAAIPIAALGLLNPMLAGAAMALSSVFVVSNSLRLRNFR
ncbi:copper-translocating P-type ATPase [Nocardia panacis]|uniref:Cation-transporting P-type ATPase B n=1 Tax=Nocardia panacis TaxID=2340916 RepID=A0A3A4L1Y1_9NOCA|nr:heavy metal translocating P-type ATPase [Nocardia panacis]RJO76353.1 copper-translocating P-type ATPase [Nocardia panacis]